MSAQLSNVREIDKKYSGSKPLCDDQHAERIKHNQSLRGFKTQLHTERELLKANGEKAGLIEQLLARWKRSMEKWLKNIKNDNKPLTVNWGTARTAVMMKPELKITREICDLVSILLAEEGSSIIDGSSTTGFMGYSNQSFHKAATAEFEKRTAKGLFYKSWEAINTIYTIPLHWTLDQEEQREIASKTNSPKYRCPPRICIAQRTFDFLVKKPKRVIAYPGGIGTLFEIITELIVIQLRKLLLTVATGWDSAPPLYLIDCQDDDDEWFWEGLVILLRRMVKLGVIDQKDIDFVYIVRVGKGQSKDSSNGSQVGPRVRYFQDPDAAARFIVSDR